MLLNLQKINYAQQKNIKRGVIKKYEHNLLIISNIIIMRLSLRINNELLLLMAYSKIKKKNLQFLNLLNHRY